MTKADAFQRVVEKGTGSIQPGAEDVEVNHAGHHRSAS